MHRYRTRTLGFFCAAIVLSIAGCTLPSSRENLEAATGLVATQTSAAVLWRRDASADEAARKSAEAMLEGGLTLEESVAVAFLASPDLQLALEQLEVSRAQLVAASTPPNPVAIMGLRDPGGRWSAFYPDHNLTTGILMNVMALLTMPDRRSVAQHDLERTRYQVAGNISQIAARVAQGWLEYRAALDVEELKGRSLAIVQTATENLQSAVAANAELDPGARVRSMAGQRASLFGAQNAQLRARIERVTAREKLGQLLGIAGWRDDWSITGDLPPLPPVDMDAASLEVAALEKRLDVQAAAKAVDARLRLLAMQRRFRWLNQLDLGVFRDKVSGGTAFTGPNAVVEIPLFDQRQAQLLNADSELRSAMRTLESVRLSARAEIRIHAQEMSGTRGLLERYADYIVPNQQQLALALGSGGDPGASDRLNLRLTAITTEEDQVGLLRDYWRARSALAVSLADWPSAQLSH